MCFSATASFASGAVLSVVGIAAIRKAKTPSRRVFASIPFIFAVQQLSEVFVWLSLTKQALFHWQFLPAYIFLSVAYIVWPVWIPLSILLLEKKSKRKNILYLLFGAGLVLAVYHTVYLVFYPVIAEIDGYHIRYKLSFPPALFIFSSIFYAGSTVLPTFISGIKRMWLLGVCITLAYIVTAIFYHAYIISVWCYFAAFISIIVYWIVVGLKNNSTNN